MKNSVVTGIDVGKTFSEVAVLKPDNEVFARMKVNHCTLEDYHKLLALLQRAEKEFKEKPAIVMESTGHYFKLLFYFLNKNGYEVSIINPIQTDSIKNLSIRKVKNDKVDAKKIALVYKVDDINPTGVPDEQMDTIKSLCRQYQKLTCELTSYKTRLIAVIDQIMLNYSEVFDDICSPTSLAVLERWPTPTSMLDADKNELIKVIACTARKNLKWACDKYDILVSKAREFVCLSISTPANILILNHYIKLIRALNESIEEFENGLLKFIDQVNPDIKEKLRLLCTLPGIGTLTAAVILSEIGDISLFPSPDKLVAYCGLDASVKQSGQFEGTRNKISKRGSRYLRKALYMAAVNSVSEKDGKAKNPVLREFYLKKCSCKPKPVALVAVMRKIMTYVYAILRDRKDFVLRDPKEHEKILQQNNQKANKVA